MSSLTYFLEPLVIVLLLLGGTLANRRRNNRQAHLRHQYIKPIQLWQEQPSSDLENGCPWVEEVGSENKTDDKTAPSPTLRTSRSLQAQDSDKWRTRKIGIFGWKTKVITPATRRYRGSFMSRIIYRFPFLIEAWYWFLIYWVYQIGRAVTALMINQGVVHVARDHAMQIISLERTLNIFQELQLQRAFLQHPALMAVVNAIYSYVHIPATILFLTCLYYVTITSPNIAASLRSSNRRVSKTRCLTGRALYSSRRRTLATSNLIAFVIFTTWPLMPPRLLSDKSVIGPSGDKARAFGFVDTVHRIDKTGGSIWTTNKFCNQWAAMPSLHFGYALIIGATIITLPFASPEPEEWDPSGHSMARSWSLPTWQTMLCVGCGICYPMVILIAVITTANHFFLDVVGGTIVVALAWFGERVLLNLLPLEDWFLSLLRIHKPDEGQDHGRKTPC
ncbi:MAG: hypothetical protein Q9217_006573 [Psora testacea]